MNARFLAAEEEDSHSEEDLPAHPKKKKKKKEEDFESESQWQQLLECNTPSDDDELLADLFPSDEEAADPDTNMDELIEKLFEESQDEEPISVEELEELMAEEEPPSELFEEARDKEPNSVKEPDELIAKDAPPSEPADDGPDDEPRDDGPNIQPTGGWGCSKCRWVKKGCGICRDWASTGHRGYFQDPDGYIAHR